MYHDRYHVYCRRGAMIGIMIGIMFTVGEERCHSDPQHRQQYLGGDDPV